MRRALYASLWAQLGYRILQHARADPQTQEYRWLVKRKQLLREDYEGGMSLTVMLLRQQEAMLYARLREETVYATVVPGTTLTHGLKFGWVRRRLQYYVTSPGLAGESSLMRFRLNVGALVDSFR